MNRIARWFDRVFSSGKDDAWRHFPVVDTPESTFDLPDSIRYMEGIQDQIDADPGLVKEAQDFERKKRARREAGDILF